MAKHGYDGGEWERSLQVAYEIEDVTSFAGHVLGYAAKLEALSMGERLRVQVAARAAYVPVEQARWSADAARIAAMSDAECFEEGAAWLN